MAKSSAWGIKHGLILAIFSVVGIFTVSEAAPRLELKPILYGLAGAFVVGSIVSGIKYELANGDNSRPVVRRNPNLVRRRESSLVRSSNPMTELAQRAPNSMSRFLDRNNRRSNYVQGLREGKGIANSYIERLPKHSNIKRIIIIPEHKSLFRTKHSKAYIEK